MTSISVNDLFVVNGLGGFLNRGFYYIKWLWSINNGLLSQRRGLYWSCEGWSHEKILDVTDF